MQVCRPALPALLSLGRRCCRAWQWCWQPGRFSSSVDSLSSVSSSGVLTLCACTSLCRSPPAIQSETRDVSRDGTLLLHFMSHFSLSLFSFEVKEESLLRRTIPTHCNKKRARNDVSIFLTLLSYPEGGKSLVREDVEKMWKSRVCVW